MVSRARNSAALGFVLLLATATLAFAGPMAGTASANACHRFGDRDAAKLTHWKARHSIRCFINKARARHGRARLHKSRRLKFAAQGHSGYMRRHHCFSHQCPGERSLDARVRGVDYLSGGLTSWAYGEDIAYGVAHWGTPRDIFHAWMHSPGHRANILYPSFRDIGIGFVRGAPENPKANGGIYTADFGYRHG